MVDEEDFFRLALDKAGNALAVDRAEGEDFEDEQVERALEEGDTLVVVFLGSHSTRSMHSCWVECQPGTCRAGGCGFRRLGSRWSPWVGAGVLWWIPPIAKCAMDGAHRDL